MKKIPFVDLKAQYNSIKKDIDQAIINVIDKTDFILGKEVKLFEKNFKEKYNVRNCISVANGTDAIYATLKMLKIGVGDEVITVANSWISSSETISQAGAKAVFIDIDQFHNINVELIEDKITAKTKAIIAVHLYGNPCQINEIKRICKENSIFLIEDCAQSHFAEFNNKLVGTFGNAATFSFYPGKNLGAYGDAGCIITNDDSLAEKIRMYVRHGALIKHNHKIEGINSRMDTIQAAILNVKLNYITKWNEMRIKNAEYYKQKLSNVKQISCPSKNKNVKHVFHVYCVRAERRDELKDFLIKKGVGISIHYPTILPLLDAYKYLNLTKDDFPVAFDFQKKILSLPMFPEMTKDQIDYVVNNIMDFYNQ